MTQKQTNNSETRKPLVSIGVPVYNGEKYLEECLESILKQTYDNWECVICNNYSTDQTPEIAEKYVKKDSRFRLVHASELLPITSNWNFCFSNISNEAAYFKILPADDWIFPNFLSEMVGVMEVHPEAGICASYRLVDKEVISDGLDIYQGSRFTGKGILTEELKQKLNITSSVNAVLYRISKLKNLNYYPEIYHDESFHIDTFLAYELLSQSDLGFVFKVLSYTRRHQDSVTSTVTEKLNTRVFFREYALSKFKKTDHSLEAEYKNVRIQYAYFLLKNKLLSKKNILNWHHDRLKLPITFREYLHAMLRKIVTKHV